MMSAVDNSGGLRALRERLRMGGGARPGLAGFWAWWTRALASWLPPRLRALFGLAQDRLLLQDDGEALRIDLDTEQAQRTLGRIPPQGAGEGDPLPTLLPPAIAGLPRWWLLPCNAGLRRRLQLPAAAGERLRDVLGFELDRQTPFQAQDVYYDARVAGRRDDGQLDVDLVVVPRAVLDARLSRLGDIGKTLAGVDMLGDDGVPLQVNLLPVDARRRGGDPSRRGLALTLGLVAVAALALGMWLLLDNRRAAADAFEQRVRQVATRARAASEQRRQLEDTVTGMGFLQTLRAGRPTMVELLDELARRLPDNTYLEKVSVEDDQLQLIGLSSDASALPGVLEGSKLWRKPALSGAVQPDPQSGRDRFTLTANLVVTATDGGGNAARTD